MHRTVVTVMSVAALALFAWAGTDPSLQADNPVHTQNRNVTGTSEGTGVRNLLPTCDVPEGYVPRNAPTGDYIDQPVAGPAVDDDGTGPSEPRSLWGPDVTVYSGTLFHVSPYGRERMLSQDQTKAGRLYAAFVRDPGDTIVISRSLDGGNNWSRWTWVAHGGQELTSPELIIGEGASDYVFLFFKTSAGNGDIYLVRWPLGGGGGTILQVRVGAADTIANCAACKDIENAYYLYCTYEKRTGGNYDVWTVRSTDYGQTWSTTGGEIVDCGITPKPDICYGSGGRLYVLFNDIRQTPRPPDTAALRVKISTDRGSTWQQSNHTGTPIVPVFDGVLGSTHGTTQTIWVVHNRDMDDFNGKGIGVFTYYSTDNGANWTYGGDNGIGNGDTDGDEELPSIACHWEHGSPTVAYAFVPGESLMFTWTSFSSPNGWTAPIGINDHQHTGWFAPCAGWKNIDLSTSYSTVMYSGVNCENLYFDAWSMVGVEEEQPAAGLSGLGLATARPNPTDRHAAIEYSLPNPGAVDLAVFDISGRRAATLASGLMPAGNHSAAWNASELPAGVYFCKLSFDGKTLTSRAVVSR